MITLFYPISVYFSALDFLWTTAKPSLEIQRLIIQFVYFPGQKVPNHTALLTNKHFHNLAYPTFFANYPFSCHPIKEGDLDAGSGEGSPSGGDILRIVWPHDDEIFRPFMFEEDWLDGLVNVFETLYSKSLKDLIDEGLYDKEYEDDLSDETFDDDAPLTARAEGVGLWMIEENPFFRQLKKMGKEKAAKIEELRITWGRGGTLRTGEWYESGPYAVAIMSVVCELWLPGLKRVSLKGTMEPSRWCDTLLNRREGENDEEFDKRLWPDHLKEEMIGDKELGDFGLDNVEYETMIKALWLLRDSCEGLEKLTLKEWNYRGRAEWWREVLEKDGLKVDVQRTFPEAAED